jgi:predicted exporter
MSAGARVAMLAWLALVVVCGWIASQARYTADMSAFLPRLATPMQQLLADQLRDGIAARLVLIGIDNAPPDALAQVSKALAARLAANPDFVYVANGDAALASRDRDFLFAHRYTLSPTVTPERFTDAGLAAALERSYALLASPAGALVRRYLPADPTGEFFAILGVLQGARRTPMHDGVWMSRDGTTALALAQTAAPGFDIDAQAANVAAVRAAFEDAKRAAGAAEARLTVTGPAIFAVESRDAIRSDAERLSAIAAIAVACMLLVAFRSPRLAALAFVPVATGALAGVAAVALGFGTVHGITLGFGVTLIGEAVDYAIYVFSRRDAETLAPTWRTLRLGAALSAASFCAMLFSGFPGLAQLGLFSVAGLVVALGVTRWLLPPFMGHGALPPLALAIADRVPRAAAVGDAFRWLVLGGAVAAGVAVAAFNTPIWDDALERLNPVSLAAQRADQRIRDELGAPDVRLMAVVAGDSRDATLEGAEALAPTLDALSAAGAIAGYETPARWLPSARTQAARRAALPDAPTLAARLERAVADSPFRADTFAPFLRDAARAKEAAPLAPAALRGTALGLQTDAMLLERAGRWYALLPLNGVRDEAALAARLQASGIAVELLDLKRESNVLMTTYRRQALALCGAGAAAIVALLAWHLRSPTRVLRAAAPVAAAVIGTAAIVLADGAKLTIFHLVALLLVAGIASNYALFFERAPEDDRERRATAFSTLFCAATTGLAFGLLALSRTPVLGIIGGTVAVGAVLGLAFAALVGREAPRPVC